MSENQSELDAARAELEKVRAEAVLADAAFKVIYLDPDVADESIEAERVQLHRLRRRLDQATHRVRRLENGGV